MGDKHWSDEQLVARLYGIGPEDGHLDQCSSCARRWEVIRLKHEELRNARLEVSDEYLVVQRRAIHARLGEKRRPLPRVLIPALATLLLAVIIVIYRPAPAPPPVTNHADSQLFEDVFRIVSDSSPSAVQPIRSLFEEGRRIEQK